MGYIRDYVGESYRGKQGYSSHGLEGLGLEGFGFQGKGFRIAVGSLWSLSFRMLSCSSHPCIRVQRFLDMGPQQWDPICGLEGFGPVRSVVSCRIECKIR